MHKKLLSWVLIVQFILGSSYPLHLAQAEPPAATEPAEHDDFLKALSESSETSQPMLPLDNFNLLEQYHYIYRAEEAGTDAEGRRLYNDVVAEEHSLSKIDSNNPQTQVANLDKEVRVVYDSAKREVRFEKIVWDKARRDYRVTEAHAIRGVTSTLTGQNHIVSDRIVTLISTPDGVRAIFTPLLKDILFRGPIPNSVLLPTYEKILPGARITNLQFLIPEAERRQVHDQNGQESDYLRGHDLLIEVTLPSGEKKFIRQDYGALVKMLGVHQANVVLQANLVDPNLEKADLIQKVLVQHAQEMEQVNEAKEQIVDRPDNAGSDLQRHALHNLAHLLPNSTLPPLLEKKGGADAFGKLAGEVRYGWKANDWEADYAYLQNAHQLENQIATEAGVDPSKVRRNWYALMVDRFEDPDTDLRAKIEKAVEAEKARSQNFIKSLFGVAKSYLSNPTRLVVLSAMLGTDTANYFTDGRVTQWGLGAITHIFSKTLEMPLIKGIAGKLAATGSYYEQPWALTTLGLGIAGILALRPLAYFVAETYSFIRGNRNPDGSRWDKVKSFFTYGLRLYAYGNYPVQKLIWERLLGQSNLYRAFDAGGGILTPGALHVPFVKSHASSQLDKLDKAVVEKAQRHERSLLIAACVLSEKWSREGRAVDPATLLQLLEAHGQNKMGLFIERLKTIPEDAAWSELSMKIYKELAKLPDSGLGKLDSEEVEKYYKLLRKVAQSVHDPESVKPGIVSRVIGTRWKAFQRWTSSNALPFLFYGKTQYNMFRKYRRAEMDERNGDTVRHQLDADYDFSTLYYGGVDPRNFGSMARGSVRSTGEVVANMLEQIFIYGIQNGVDGCEYHKDGASLVNPAPSLTVGAFARNSVKPGAGGREQSLGEATAAIHGGLLSPQPGRGILNVQLTRMTNAITGFQVRLLAGGLFRMASLGFIALAAGSALGDAGFQALSGVPKQINVLFNKMSLVYDAAGIALGYAVVWAPVIASQNFMKDRTDPDRAQLQKVDALLEEGLRLENENTWRKATADLLELYRVGGTPIPNGLGHNAELYSPDQAKALAEYSRIKPPVATIANPRIQRNLNNIGALISSILFAELSNRMYVPGVDVLPQIASSMAGFTMTYLGATQIALPITQWLAKKVSYVFQAHTKMCLQTLRSIRGMPPGFGQK